MHEQFHKYFTEEDKNGSRRYALVGEFLGDESHPVGIIEHALRSLDSWNGSQAEKAHLRNLLTQLSSIENYKGFDPKIEEIEDEDKRNRVKRRILVEEFLVESFTDRSLTSYLNSIKYGNAKTSDVTNKSLLQKIIECIVKLFNLIRRANEPLLKIEDSTILAREYVLLSEKLDNNTLNAPSNIQQQSNDANNEGSNANNTSQERDIEDLTLFSSIIRPECMVFDSDELARKHREECSSINSSRVSTVSSMNDFINDFPRQVRAEISSMIERGQVNYICK